jgi:hypothetical protein
MQPPSDESAQPPLDAPRVRLARETPRAMIAARTLPRAISNIVIQQTNYSNNNQSTSESFTVPRTLSFQFCSTSGDIDVCLVSRMRPD